MAILGRIVVIWVALVLASIAAGIAIAIGIFGHEWHAMSSGDVPDRVFFWGTAFFATFFAGVVTFLPTVLLIIAAESMKVRSLFVYAIVGALLLLGGYYTSGMAPHSYEESIDAAPPMVPRPAELAAAAGAVFGLTYWLIAGRSAGRWRERRSPSA
jgi:hypothetical protein